MFRKIVLALTATAALSATVLVPTTVSARPIPHLRGGAIVGLPYFAGLPPLPGMRLACRHFSDFRGVHPFGCRWVATGGGRYW
jgi:hypothetical protein